MKPQQAFYLRVSAIVGALAVALGAFGAHGLKTIIESERIEVWEVAVRYHFYHAIVLLVLALGPASIWEGPWAARASKTILIGILLFSGSLYALAATGFTALGPLTPIGGLTLIAGWVSIAFAAGTARR